MSFNIHIAPDVETAVKFAAQEEAERQEFLKDEYIKSQTLQAEKGLNPVEELQPGYDPFKSMSWDNSPGHYKRRHEQLKFLRRNGYPVKPQATRLHGGPGGCDHCDGRSGFGKCAFPQGTTENVYTHKLDLELIARGIVCNRCGNFQPENVDSFKEQHRKLAQVTGRGEVSEHEMKQRCCWCGDKFPEGKPFD